MIIIKVNGGLGNQMFQYAFGRGISLALGVEMKLDISWFNAIAEQDTIRHYELNCFSTKIEIASTDEVKKIKGRMLHLPRRVRNFLSKLKLLSQKSYFLEKYYHYDSSVALCPDKSYFEGYWQSYRYFDKYREIIREDFIYKDALSETNKKYKEYIVSQNSVSLHIRRGDYVTNSNANGYHGVSSLDYYYSAMNYIAQRVEDAHFFIFSDDIEWVKENLNSQEKMTFAENKANTKAFEEIYLMSLCQHNIIANSTFSWWGAYLNVHNEKIVIAPKIWFKDTEINTNDLIPESWIRM